MTTLITIASITIGFAIVCYTLGYVSVIIKDKMSKH